MTKTTTCIFIACSTLGLTMSLSTSVQAFTGSSTTFPPTHATETLSMPGGVISWLADKATKSTTVAVPVPVGK